MLTYIPNFRTLMKHKAFFYMVQDIHANNGEGCLFLDCFEWISRISCDVCEKTTHPRTKRTKKTVAILAQAIFCLNVHGVFPVHELFWFCLAHNPVL